MLRGLIWPLKFGATFRQESLKKKKYNLANVINVINVLKIIK